MAKQYEYPIDIDSGFYSAIGEIVARWAWLEHRLGVLIREGFDLDKGAGRVLLDGSTVQNLLRITDNLTELDRWIGDVQVRNEVRAFGEAVESYRKRRNNFVHGIYGSEMSDPNSLCRLLDRGGERFLTPDGVKINVNELNQFAHNLRTLQVRGLALTDKLKESQKG